MAHHEDRLKTSHDADSLRLLLAIKLREANTVEDRTRAVSILKEMRPRHMTDRGFCLELAQTYVASRRFHDARSTLPALAKRDSTDVGARLWAARLLIKDMCHPLRTSWDARGLTEQILVRDEADSEACLLNAVHCMDLGESEDADYWFRLGPGGAGPVLIPPNLTMIYETGLLLSLSDRSLHAEWNASPGVATFLEEVSKSEAPTLPMRRFDAVRIFVSHAGARDKAGMVREGCIVAIPPWSREQQWWKGATVTLHMLDSE